MRQSYDLRTTSNDNSQRMLNALLPGTVVPIHRHPQSTENVLLLCGKLVEVIYDENGNEKERIHLDHTVGNLSLLWQAIDSRIGKTGKDMGTFLVYWIVFVILLALELYFFGVVGYFDIIDKPYEHLFWSRIIVNEPEGQVFGF